MSRAALITKRGGQFSRKLVLCFKRVTINISARQIRDGPVNFYCFIERRCRSKVWVLGVAQRRIAAAQSVRDYSVTERCRPIFTARRSGTSTTEAESAAVWRISSG